MNVEIISINMRIEEVVLMKLLEGNFRDRGEERQKMRTFVSGRLAEPAKVRRRSAREIGKLKMKSSPLASQPVYSKCWLKTIIKQRQKTKSNDVSQQ